MKLIVLSSLIALVFSELTINSFLTKVQAGTEVKIVWSYDGTPAIDGKLTFELADGSADALNTVGPIASDVDPNAKTLTWTVPKALDNKDDYTIKVRGNSASGIVYRYTGRFGISGGSGKPAQSPSASAPPSTKTSAPSPASNSTSKPTPSKEPAGNIDSSADIVSVGVLSLFGWMLI